MIRSRRVLRLLRPAALLLVLALCGCASLLGYSMGRMVDTGLSRTTAAPACGTHPLRQGQQVTVILKDGTKHSGLYQWHDCGEDSLFVLWTEVSAWDMPGRRADTLRVPLREIEAVHVPRQGARYVGLVIGAGLDFLVWATAVSIAHSGWGID